MDAPLRAAHASCACENVWRGVRRAVGHYLILLAITCLVFCVVGMLGALGSSAPFGAHVVLLLYGAFAALLGRRLLLGSGTRPN